MAELEFIEIGPEDQAEATVIWMHGLGADGHDFEPIVPELNVSSKIRFIFPHAPHRPVTINNGFVMRAWYDILETGLNARQDEAGVRASSQMIEMIIKNENERGVPSHRIVLAGFSQGGAMTLFTGLRYPEKLAGLIVLSAYLPIAEKLVPEIRDENLSLPIFMAHGTFDPMVPMALGERSRINLEDLGAKIEWHTYPMPHSVHPQEIMDIGRWLNRVLG